MDRNERILNVVRDTNMALLFADALTGAIYAVRPTASTEEVVRAAKRFPVEVLLSAVSSAFDDFTDEELDRIHEWFSTGIGKKMANTTPLVLTGIGVTMRMVLETMRKTACVLDEEVNDGTETV